METASHTLPKRKSPRASWLDYNDGMYFVTVCTKDKAHYFGEIADDAMHLTPIGSYLESELRNADDRHPNVAVLSFVVMPNHFHAIVKVASLGTRPLADAPRRVPTREERLAARIGAKRQSGNAILSLFIGLIKGAVTRFARKESLPFGWQTRYHDHKIRGPRDCNNIAEYIEHNVLNWATDCFSRQ